jgi:hypothetical protein
MSTLKADTIVAADGSSPVTLTKQSAAKAWVLFRGDTNVIRNSFNFSSLTDNDTGSYDANWTNSFDGASNYVGAGSCIGSDETSSGSLGNVFGTGGSGFTASTMPISTRNATGTRFDNDHVHLVAHGDLA